MMKNILCGLMVLGCISGNCWGMKAEMLEQSKIRSLVSDVAVFPEDSADLRSLVCMLLDTNNGQKNSEMAIECCDSWKFDNNIKLEQVACMLQTVLRDWSDYGYVMSVDYYINGAFSGKFGPYNIPDEVDCY